MTLSQLLAKLDKAWAAFNDSYADLPESKLLIPGVTGNWSIKDIIAHVTVWEEESLAHLPHIAAAERTPKYSDTYGGIDAFNALKTEEFQKLSLNEVLHKRDQTHQRLIDYLHTIPEELIKTDTRFRRRLRVDTYSHYPKHTAAIWKWRKSQNLKPETYEKISLDQTDFRL